MQDIILQAVQALADARRYVAGDWSDLEQALTNLGHSGLERGTGAPVSKKWVAVRTSEVGVALSLENGASEEHLQLTGDYPDIETKLAYAEDLARRLSQ